MKINSEQIEKFFSERTFIREGLPNLIRFLGYEWEDFKKNLKSKENDQ